MTTDTKEKKKIYNKRWYEANKIYHKKYIKKNKDKKNERERIRLQTDPLYKLRKDIGVSIYKSFSKNKFIKTNITSQILGCTFEEFKQHLELQFEPWMNWDNRGSKIVEGPNISWDIDHIIPLSTAKTEDDVRRLNHYTNLKPLCSYHNRFIKRDKHG